MGKKRIPQIEMLACQSLAYGGELLKTRKGRAHGRTLDTKNTMHLVLRSSKAVGPWSFAKGANQRKIHGIFEKFAKKYGVRVYSVAYVGNHVHSQIKLTSRHTYKQFIRAVTAAIAMSITGVSRWNKNALTNKVGGTAAKGSFWDYRPFTRVVRGLRAVLALKDYIEINRYEGWGYSRNQARFLAYQDKTIRAGPYRFLT